MIDPLTDNFIPSLYKKEIAEKPTIIIHIGLPKTATTTLQKRLFTSIEKIHYLGKTSTKKGIALRNFLHHSPPPRNLFSKANSPFFSSDKPYLFSEETLYRTIFQDHQYKLIENLKKISQHCKLKLIITTRAQEHLIPSYYLFKISFTPTPNVPFEKRVFLKEENQSFNTFYFFKKPQKTSSENYWEMKKNHNIAYLTDSSFDYLHLYKLFNQFIPKENLLMLPMEGILSEDFSYREKLFRFITQRKASEKEKELLKTFHLYQDNPSPHPHYKEEMQRFYNTGYANRIFEIYKKSNEKLAALLKLPLKKFSYY